MCIILVSIVYKYAPLRPYQSVKFHGATLAVILSEAKNLWRGNVRILRFAQNDRHKVWYHAKTLPVPAPLPLVRIHPRPYEVGARGLRSLIASAPVPFCCPLTAVGGAFLWMT